MISAERTTETRLPGAFQTHDGIRKLVAEDAVVCVSLPGRPDECLEGHLVGYDKILMFVEVDLSEGGHHGR